MAAPEQRSVYVRDADGRKVLVDVAQARDGYLKGVYTPDSSTVRVGRGDQTATVDAAQIQQAIDSGWNPITDGMAENARYAREAKTTGAQIRGGVESLASGLSMGLSDVALDSASTFEDKKAYRARAKALGDTGDALRLVGEVAPTLLSGGAAAGAKIGATGARLGLRGGVRSGVRAAGVLPRAVEGAGLLAERGAQRLLGKGLRGRVAGSAARGAVEGAASGVSQEIRESVLGDREITAERLMASGAMAGVFGGVAGGALPLAGRAAAGVARVPVKATREVVGKLGKLAPEGATVGEFAQTIASGKSARAAVDQAKMLGNKKDAARLHEALHNTDAAREKLGTEIKNAVDSLGEAQRKAVAAFEKDKRANFGKLMDDADPAARVMAQDDVAEISTRLRDHLIDAKNPEYKASFLQRPLDKADARLAVLNEELQGTIKPGEAYNMLHGGLRDLQADMRKVRKAAQKDPAAEATLEILEDIEAGFRQSLGSTKYGRAADAFTDVGRADAVSFGLKKDTERTAVGRLLDRDKLSTNADALEVVKTHGQFKSADRLSRADEYLDADTLAMKKRAEFSDSPEVKKAVDDYIKQRAALRKTMNDSSDLAQILDRGTEMNRSPLSGFLAAFGPSGLVPTGAALAGAPGAAVAAMVGYMARPGQTIRSLSAIRHFVDKTGFDLDGVIAKVTSASPAESAAKVGRAVTRAGRIARRKATRAAARGRGVATRAAGQRGQQRIERQREQARKAVEMSDLETLTRELEGKMYAVERVAPNLAGVAKEKAHRAAMFLADKLPPEVPDPITGRKRVIPDSMRDKFDRYYEAVTNPVEALKKLDGGAFTMEHAEAIKAVYPAIYADMQGKVFAGLQAAADRGEEIPYARRIRLGILFGLPTDPTMTPEFQASLAAAHGETSAVEDAQELAAAPKPQAPDRARKVTYKAAGRYHTPIGRIESNR